MWPRGERRVVARGCSPGEFEQVLGVMCTVHVHGSFQAASPCVGGGGRVGGRICSQGGGAPTL